MKSKHLFKLYITGEGTKPKSSIRNLQRICEEYFRGECNIVVIDLLEHPRLAEDEKVLATPMLVREYPLPPRRIIGDLSDTERVFQALGLAIGRRGEPRGGTEEDDPGNDDDNNDRGGLDI